MKITAVNKPIFLPMRGSGGFSPNAVETMWLSRKTRGGHRRLGQTRLQLPLTRLRLLRIRAVCQRAALKKTAYGLPLPPRHGRRYN